jgi:two-component system OmpR family sensor kinase
MRHTIKAPRFYKKVLAYLLHGQVRLKVMAGVVAVTLAALAAFDLGAMAVMRGSLLGQTDGVLVGALQAAQSKLCAEQSLPGIFPAGGAASSSGGSSASGAAGGKTGSGPGPIISCQASGEVKSRAGGGPVKLPPAGPVFISVSNFSIIYLKPGGGQVPIQVGLTNGQPGNGLWTLSQAAALLAATPGAHTVVSGGTGGPGVSEQVRAVSAKVAGGTLVASTPLSQVDQIIDDIGMVVAAGSGLVVLLIAAGVYLVLRRGLRPIEAMAAQADRITAGDLTQRVTSHHPRSEVGRLGTALNGMLARIEASVEERAAGERHMRRFFADASHELRTPLASLRANAELYNLGAVPGGPELDEVMRRITLEARRMSRLVDDMFRLARLGAQPTQAKEPVDLTALVESCADRARVAEPDRAWRVRVAPGLWCVGDEELLRRAIDNLVTNVRVHTPRTAIGTISAALRGDGGQVAVEVSDDGPGVPEDKLPRIFERFYRAGSASRPGSGLGLAIVSEIAVAHGGCATAAPNVPVGLRVSLGLPRMPAPDGEVLDGAATVITGRTSGSAAPGPG